MPEVFSRDDTPVFVKDTSYDEVELEELKRLRESLSGEKRRRIDREIKLLEAGVYGENAVAFELRNSHLPIHVLRDLNLEHDGLTAQIDFLVIAPFTSVVIECKNLVGNVHIDEKGNFTRTFGTGRFKTCEGFYSPITQNERHIRLIRSLRDDTSTLVKVGNAFFFDDLYRPIVVLANPKTVLDDKHAPKDVRRQIVRLDKLVSYIKGLDKKGLLSNIERLNAEDREQIARWWLSKHVERNSTRVAKYLPEQGSAVAGAQGTGTKNARTQETGQGAGAHDAKRDGQGASSDAPSCPKCGSPMVLRTATRGERAGKHFWGCSNYPSCYGIINIED